MLRGLAAGRAGLPPPGSPRPVSIRNTVSESVLECRALSVAEYLGGGLALASIALIPVGGAHMARPQASVPAVPLHYAAAAIETNEAVAKLSLASPKPAPGETR